MRFYVRAIKNIAREAIINFLFILALKITGEDEEEFITELQHSQMTESTMRRGYLGFRFCLFNGATILWEQKVLFHINLPGRERLSMHGIDTGWFPDDDEDVDYIPF